MEKISDALGMSVLFLGSIFIFMFLADLIICHIVVFQVLIRGKQGYPRKVVAYAVINCTLTIIIYLLVKYCVWKIKQKKKINYENEKRLHM